MTAMERGSPNLVKKIKNKTGIKENPEREIAQDENVHCLSLLFKEGCHLETAKILAENYDRTKLLLIALKKVSAENNASYLVTILTDPAQASSVSKKQDPKRVISNSYPQKDIKEFLEEENIAYFDLLETFEKSNSEDFYFKQDGHFNKNGHKLFGDLLTTEILSRYLTSP